MWCVSGTQDFLQMAAGLWRNSFKPGPCQNSTVYDPLAPGLRRQPEVQRGLLFFRRRRHLQPWAPSAHQRGPDQKAGYLRGPARPGERSTTRAASGNERGEDVLSYCTPGRGDLRSGCGGMAKLLVAGWAGPPGIRIPGGLAGFVETIQIPYAQEPYARLMLTFCELHPKSFTRGAQVSIRVEVMVWSLWARVDLASVHTRARALTRTPRTVGRVTGPAQVTCVCCYSRLALLSPTPRERTGELPWLGLLLCTGPGSLPEKFIKESLNS